MKVKVKCSSADEGQRQRKKLAGSIKTQSGRNMAYDYTRRIVLFGKTGSGKSSLCNTLFGAKDLFKVSASPNSETKVCKSETKTVNGRRIQLIDTPGLFDTDAHSTQLSPELLECIIECNPGPHVFLLVMQVEKFTVQERSVVDLILKNFSEKVLKFTTVVFTHGDQLDEGRFLKEWVKENKDLNALVQKCGGRCHVFDNKYWKNNSNIYRNNQYQIEQLLQTIDQTVRDNGGGYYTNEMLQKVQKEIEKATKKIIRTNPTISSTEVSEMVKKQVTEALLKVGLIYVGAGIGAAAGSVGGPVGAVVGAGIGAGVGAVVAAGKWLSGLF